MIVSLFYMLACARERYSVVPVPGVRAAWRDAWKRWICRGSAAGGRVGPAHAGAEPSARPVGRRRASYFRIVPPRRADSAQTLARVLPALWEHARYAVLHLTPGHPFKRWHLAGWARWRAGCGRAGLEVVLTGGDGHAERAYLDAARRTSRRRA